jgi:hypothetical protein
MCNLAHLTLAFNLEYQSIINIICERGRECIHLMMLELNLFPFLFTIVETRVGWQRAARCFLQRINTVVGHYFSLRRTTMTV